MLCMTKYAVPINHERPRKTRKQERSAALGHELILTTKWIHWPQFHTFFRVPIEESIAGEAQSVGQAVPDASRTPSGTA